MHWPSYDFNEDQSWCCDSWCYVSNITCTPEKQKQYGITIGESWTKTNLWYSVQCAVCSVQCARRTTVHNIQEAVCSMQYAVCSMQYVGTRMVHAQTRSLQAQGRKMRAIRAMLRLTRLHAPYYKVPCPVSHAPMSRLTGSRMARAQTRFLRRRGWKMRATRHTARTPVPSQSPYLRKYRTIKAKANPTRRSQVASCLNSVCNSTPLCSRCAATVQCYCAPSLYTVTIHP